MKIETFDREDHQKKIIAEFDADSLERFKHHAARKIASEARIPGFRPGKAPYDVIRRTYGDQAILDEALNLLLDDSYPKIIEEAGIQSYGPGKVDEIITLDPPKFSFLIPLAPEVDLGDYRAIRKEHTPPTVGEDKVDEVIERLRRRSGTAVEVDHAAEKGDLVAIKLAANLAEPAEGEDPVLIEEKTYEMVAGIPEEHTDGQGNEWPFPGFVDQLVGLKKDETKTVLYTFAEEDADDDLNGKQAEFRFTVESVKEIHKPELDDEFATTLGPYETMDAVRADILKQLQENETQNYDRDYIDDLIEQLVAGATVKFPPVLVEDEVAHTLKHFEEDLGRQQMDLEAYLKTREISQEDFIEKEVRPAAEERVRRQLVLEEFATQENIELGPQEVQMVYNMALNQAKSDAGMRKAVQGKMNTKELANTLARSTINEIFNQRMLNRIRAIAVGEADKQPVEDEAKATAEPTTDAAPAAEVEAQPAAAEESAPAETSAENTGESSPEA